MKHPRNICRLDGDNNGTYGWIVRIRRKKHGIAKIFSDSTFGGEGKALAAAIEYRDALIKAVSFAAHNLWLRKIVRRNNTSGIPGVGIYKTDYGKDKWKATWVDENGLRKSKSFSVELYGKRRARQLAIAVRQSELDRIFEVKKADPLG